MRAALPVVLGLVLSASVAYSDDASARPTSPAPAASPVPAAGPPKPLILGAYRSVNADDPAAIADELRYQEQVEVRARAMDAHTLTVRMAWWMRDFDSARGATPSSSSAPGLREMRNYRVHPADS